jgi:hypothetical protein
MDESLESKFAALKSKNLKIDLTRGKPGSDQLDLSNDLLSMTVPAEERKWSRCSKLWRSSRNTRSKKSGRRATIGTHG